jgi:thiol-disulfide isomerase/thioredoxin
VDRQDDVALAAMLPEMLQQRASFRLSDSAIFSVEEDWLAVVEYVQAVAALNHGDKATFKKHITEAFWLSPRQAAAYAPHIERLRMEEAMRGFKVDFDVEFAPLGSGEKMSVRTLLADKKALLLHFWSPWSQECDAAMPDFINTATTLSSKGLAVVSLVPEQDKEIINDAINMISSHEGAAAVKWHVDPHEKGLAPKLRVQNLPTMVIVSPQGEVLFNGGPSDPRMWDVLEKIDATIMRPARTDEDSK